MTENQFQALLATLQNSPLEYLAWVSAIVMAVAAVTALIYAKHQIEYAKSQLDAARANTKAMFLVDLDSRWEGNEMKDARAKWRDMRDFVVTTTDAKFPQLSNPEKHAKRAEVCSRLLYSMLSDNPEDYTNIMSILGFFETIGYIVDKNFISGDEVSDLYGESILEFDRLCWPHIEKRREDRVKDTGMPTKLWEHARNLIIHTREFYGIT